MFCIYLQYTYVFEKLDIFLEALPPKPTPRENLLYAPLQLHMYSIRKKIQTVENITRTKGEKLSVSWDRFNSCAGFCGSLFYFCPENKISTPPALTNNN